MTRFAHGLVFCCVFSIVCAFSLAARAQDITYEFIGTVTDPSIGPNPMPFEDTLIVTDAAVASGSLEFSFNAGVGCAPSPSPYPVCTVPTGNPNGLVYLNYSASTDYDPTDPSQSVAGPDAFTHMIITFNPDGTLNGLMQGQGTINTVYLSGDEYMWTGAVGSDGPDFPNCEIGLPPACSISGYWQTTDTLPPIPEPSSLALYIAGLAGLYFMTIWRRALKRESRWLVSYTWLGLVRGTTERHRVFGVRR